MRKRLWDVARLERILRAAMHGGYAVHVGHRQYRLTMAMDCEDPYRFELYSRGAIRDGVRVRPLTLHGETRCRKCGPCTLRRSKMWMARACHEMDKWPLTLMATFTMSPQEHFEVDVRAAKLLSQRDLDFDCVTDAIRFEARARVFGAEVTKWLKRVRSGRDGHTRVPLRYLLVAEVHDSENTDPVIRGRPHYHMLLHSLEVGSAVIGSPQRALEVGINKTSCDVLAGEWECRWELDKRTGKWKQAAYLRDDSFLRSHWSLGFSKIRWAHSAESAYYVCKYITKSMHVRVRASTCYGSPSKSWAGSRLANRESGSALTPPPLEA